MNSLNLRNGARLIIRSSSIIIETLINSLRPFLILREICKLSSTYHHISSLSQNYCTLPVEHHDRFSMSMFFTYDVLFSRMLCVPFTLSASFTYFTWIAVLGSFFIVCGSLSLFIPSVYLKNLLAARSCPCCSIYICLDNLTSSCA